MIFWNSKLQLQDIHPTIEDIYVATVETERGTREVLRFYDTQGLSSVDSAEASLLRQYYSTADAFVLVYGVDSRSSFDAIDALKKDIDRNREKREVRSCNRISTFEIPKPSILFNYYMYMYSTMYHVWKPLIYLYDNRSLTSV
jgi:NF-kappa-B inhibitor-interacting Ras-like protein